MEFAKTCLLTQLNGLDPCMYKLTKLAVSAALMVGTVMPASAGLTINLIDIGGVAGSAAEQGFKIAAKYWESVLTNDAVLNFNVGYSSLPPGVLGGTSSNLATYVPISDYFSVLGATGTSALDAQAAANLPALSLAGSVNVKVPEYFSPGTFEGVAASGSRMATDNTALSATMALSTANLKALVGGYSNVIDGEIQFSSDFSFDFDPTDGISAGSYDFIGVAVHEMGHALGFLSAAQDFDYSVGGGYAVDDYWWGYGMDMFRYSAPGVLDWTFGTNSYFSIDGGATAFGNGYFSTGDVNGDGWQASHWKEPNTPCANLRGIMNPYICNGMTAGVQGLDLAALDAIGWNTNVDVLRNMEYAFSSAQMYREFATVPEPASVALVLASMGLMAGVMRRRRRSGLGD